MPFRAGYHTLADKRSHLAGSELYFRCNHVETVGCIVQSRQPVQFGRTIALFVENHIRNFKIVIPNAPMSFRTNVRNLFPYPAPALVIPSERSDEESPCHSERSEESPPIFVIPLYHSHVIPSECEESPSKREQKEKSFSPRRVPQKITPAESPSCQEKATNTLMSSVPCPPTTTVLRFSRSGGKSPA